MYDLMTDVGYRYSNYDTTGSTNTYKFELQYAPLPDARKEFRCRRLHEPQRSTTFIERPDCRSAKRAHARLGCCVSTAFLHLLRQVVYLGLREDKPAFEVRRPTLQATT